MDKRNVISLQVAVMYLNSYHVHKAA